MLKSAECLACHAALPLFGEIWSFALPPQEIACPACRKAIPTTLLYRATWMERLVWKALTMVMVPAAFVWALLRPHPPLHLALILAGGVAAPFILSRAIAFPLTLLIDRFRK